MRNSNDILLLDCTLRDGGFAFEDAIKGGRSGDVYGNDNIKKLIDLFSQSGIEIIELGAIEIAPDDKTDMAIYQSMEAISQTIPKNRQPGQLYAALYRGPDTPIDDIPEWTEGLCDIARVILRYSELEKSLQFCEALSNKGYRVCLQPMVTKRYSESELQLVIDYANSMDAFAVYFVDSYGYMNSDDVHAYFSTYDKGLKQSICIGFHAHNNINLAYANSIEFLKIESDRKIIIDSCIMGIGQGAGNLQTELITPHLNSGYGKSYNYDMILDACEIVDMYWKESIWGYSPIYMLPAINNTAYKFAVELRHKHNLQFKEINHLLENIPEDIRHRYTPQNTLKLLDLFAREKDGKEIG
jgi:4-hydroxy 2-oxovalerate aldolase